MTQPQSSTATVIEVSEATFKRDVLDASRRQPVVVDFWAAWCGPCRTLGPVLERLAGEADGGWVLAKVDVDSNPGLAQAAGVQGIPAVRAFKDGRQVAEFTGALPEPSVREWLGALVPGLPAAPVGPAQITLEEGKEAAARGDLETAATLFGSMLEKEPAHAEARRELARTELRLRSAWLEEGVIASRLAADPLDLEAVVGSADLAAARGDLESAFDRLLSAIGSFSGSERDAVRRHLLSLLDTLAPDDKVVLGTRRRLAAALY